MGIEQAVENACSIAFRSVPEVGPIVLAGLVGGAFPLSLPPLVRLAGIRLVRTGAGLESSRLFSFFTDFLQLSPRRRRGLLPVVGSALALSGRILLVEQ